MPAQLVTGEIGASSSILLGANIPGVNVTLVNESSGEQRQATSNEAGIFVFVALPPATDTLRAEKRIKTFGAKTVGCRPSVRTSVFLVTMFLGEAQRR